MAKRFRYLLDIPTSVADFAQDDSSSVDTSESVSRPFTISPYHFLEQNPYANSHPAVERVLIVCPVSLVEVSLSSAFFVLNMSVELEGRVSQVAWKRSRWRNCLSGQELRKDVHQCVRKTWRLDASHTFSTERDSKSLFSVMKDCVLLC